MTHRGEGARPWRRGDRTRAATSAFGTFRTCRSGRCMSAVGGRADIPFAWVEVCFWTRSGLRPTQSRRRSLKKYRRQSKALFKITSHVENVAPQANRFDCAAGGVAYWSNPLGSSMFEAITAFLIIEIACVLGIGVLMFESRARMIKTETILSSGRS